MEKKVFETIEKHRLFAGCNNVIIALSGGADSMALFHFLYTCRQQLGITLTAAHFDHGLRGAESDRDADFVQRVCAQYNVPLALRRGNILQRERIKRNRPAGVGIEEWARELRYKFFHELVQQDDTCVATAHTLSDNAETVLFHAIRGTGPRGLAGIPPVRGPFVRPLLGVSRAEILAYCERNQLAYVTDSTNADLQYSRNRIRGVALPALEQAHPGAARALGRLADDMRELDAYLTQQAQALLDAAKQGEGYTAAVLLGAPQPVLLKAAGMLAGRSASRAQLERVIRVMRGELGAVQLTAKLEARLKDGVFTVAAPAALPAALPEYEAPLQAGELSLPGGYSLVVEIARVNENSAFYKKTDEKYFTFAADCDKIAKNSVFRTRRPGDEFSPAGRGVTKTLKKWMNEQKIPPQQRDAWPILCNEHRVLWVWGAGFAEGVAQDETTRQVLYIHQSRQ